MQMEEIQGSQLVTINVGGKKYTTCRQTLTQLQNFVNSDVKDNEGNIFIDRDGDYFRYVLNYLRRGKLILPKVFTDIDGLINEAQYYGAKKLVEELQKHEKKQTEILWMEEVSPTLEKQNEIMIWCSLKTMFDNEFLQSDISMVIFDKSECFWNDLRHHDRNNEVIIPYPYKFKFSAFLVKEGFEKKHSWGKFTMYKRS